MVVANDFIRVVEMLVDKAQGIFRFLEMFVINEEPIGVVPS